MFSDPGYLAATTGLKDPSDRKSIVADRNRGIQFKVNPPRIGVNNDAMFEKFKCLSVGDGKEIKVPTNEAELERKKKERDLAKKAMITNDGFKYSNPGKKATGMGSTFGCFAPLKADEIKEGKAPKEKPAAKKEEVGPKNIMTSPGKKGTYGFPGTTLGKGEEYTYKAADEKAVKKDKKKDKDKDKASKMHNGAFKAACKSIDFFDGHPNVPASKIYTIEEKFLPKVKKEVKKDRDGKDDKGANSAFKPSNPAKTGVLGTFAKFEYGGPEIKEKHKPKKKDDEKEGSKTNVVWKPTATAHSLPCKSIAYNPTAINASILRHD